MNKKVLAILAGTMLFTSVGFAAPAANLQEGQTNIGYDHYSLSHGIKDDNLYLEHALSDKFTIGVEQNSYSDNGGGSLRATDIAVKYKLDNNVYLTGANRSYNDDAYSNKFAYGIGANVNLAPKLDGYASVVATSISSDLQAGVAYNMDGQTALHFGYKSYKDDYHSTWDGVGFGVNYTF